MQDILVPKHLVMAVVISLLLLSLLFIFRKKMYGKGKWHWFWIYWTVFIGAYLLIVASALYSDISLQLDLEKFDLNGDGTFSGRELSLEQEEAMNKVISDTGRNFSVFTGLILSAAVSLLIFPVSQIAKIVRP